MYELCHGRFIRQYHEERDGKKVKRQEYFLGRWTKEEYEKMRKFSKILELEKNLKNY